MMWRQPYQTVIHRGVQKPLIRATSLLGQPFESDSYDLIVGAVSMSSFADQDVYRRLFFEAFQPERFGQIFWGCSAAEVEQIIPGSRHAHCYLAPGSHPFDEALGSLALDRAFAWVPKAELIMVGPPTEDAWEKMMAAINKSQ